jgi:hypothetical protein
MEIDYQSMFLNILAKIKSISILRLSVGDFNSNKSSNANKTNVSFEAPNKIDMIRTDTSSTGDYLSHQNNNQWLRKMMSLMA